MNDVPSFVEHMPNIVFGPTVWFTAVIWMFIAGIAKAIRLDAAEVDEDGQ